MALDDCFIYKIAPTRLEMVTLSPTPEEDLALDDHYDYLKELADAGVVLLAGRTRNNDAAAFGVVVLRVGSEAAARQIMQDDPAVKNGVMRAELYPFRIAVAGALAAE